MWIKTDKQVTVTNRPNCVYDCWYLSCTKVQERYNRFFTYSKTSFKDHLLIKATYLQAGLYLFVLFLSISPYSNLIMRLFTQIIFFTYNGDLTNEVLLYKHWMYISKDSYMVNVTHSWNKPSWVQTLHFT